MNIVKAKGCRNVRSIRQSCKMERSDFWNRVSILSSEIRDIELNETEMSNESKAVLIKEFAQLVTEFNARDGYKNE